MNHTTQPITSVIGIDVSKQTLDGYHFPSGYWFEYWAGNHSTSSGSNIYRG